MALASLQQIAFFMASSYFYRGFCIVLFLLLLMIPRRLGISIWIFSFKIYTLFKDFLNAIVALRNMLSRVVKHIEKKTFTFSRRNLFMNSLNLSVKMKKEREKTNLEGAIKIGRLFLRLSNAKTDKFLNETFSWMYTYIFIYFTYPKQEEKKTSLRNIPLWAIKSIDSIPSLYIYMLIH